MSLFIERLNSEIATLLETRANNALATWLVAFRRRQREESANPIQEEEAIGEERETVAETSVYDAAMQVNCVHSIGESQSHSHASCGRYEEIVVRFVAGSGIKCV